MELHTIITFISGCIFQLESVRVDYSLDAQEDNLVLAYYWTYCTQHCDIQTFYFSNKNFASIMLGYCGWLSGCFFAVVKVFLVSLLPGLDLNK